MTNKERQPTSSQRDEMDALATHVAELTVAHIKLESINVPVVYRYVQQALLEEVIKKLQTAV